MLPQRAVHTLGDWLDRLSTFISLLIESVDPSIDAVRAAEVLPCSNGQTDGQS